MVLIKIGIWVVINIKVQEANTFKGIRYIVLNDEYQVIEINK